MSDVRKWLPWIAISICLLCSLYSWATEGVIYHLIASADGETRIDQLRRYILGFGSLAPILYVGIVVLEVVIAPLPGLMLYAPGGIIFGPVLGGALALAGNVIGAAIACGVTRSLGESWLSRFFEPDQLEALQERLRKNGAFWIFLLRLNPLTSSDIISYAAGFTRIPISQVVLATTLGLAPLCFVQAWFAESLLTAFPDLFIPLLVVLVIYTVVVVVALFRWLKSRGRSQPDEDKSIV